MKNDEEILTRDLRALDLLSTPAPIVPDPLIANLLEELVPSFRTPANSPSLKADISEALSTLGYTGPSEPSRILRFLISTAQAQRILAHKQSPPTPTSDSRAASSLSRIQAALDVNPAPVPETIEDVTERLNLLCKATEDKISAVGEDALGKPLLAPDIVAVLPEHKEECETTLKELTKEYHLRRDMLLHRLEVTMRAFARGRDMSPFEMAYEDVRRQVLQMEDVSMFEVAVARECMLRKGVSETGGVRSVIMGSVPDRGGRIGGGEMPAFRARGGGKTVTEVVDNRQAGKGKGKGGKRRKRW